MLMVQQLRSPHEFAEFIFVKNSKESTMQKAKCPSCKQIIQLEERVKVQAFVLCPQCKSFLELVNNFPPTLALVEDPAVCSSQGILTKFRSSKQSPRFLVDTEKS
jgi:hypothetical protein